jgi:hypothetical protein
VTIEKSDNTIGMAETLDLEIRVNDAASLFGIAVQVHYDADIIEVLDADPTVAGVQITPGDFPDPDRQFVQENRVDTTTGDIHYVVLLLGDPPVDGSGVLARFRVRGLLPGTAHLDFANLTVSDGDAQAIHLAARGARVDVLPPPTVAPPASATPVPSDTPRLSPTPSNTPTITPTPSTTLTPSITPTPTRTPTPSVTPTPSITPTASHTPPPSATPTATDTRTAPPPATDTPLPSATPTITNTPRPSATPPPTSTPVVTPDGCAHPLVNGGFESDGDWTRRGSPSPRFATDTVYSGMRSLLLGIKPGEANTFSYSTAWQGVLVPVGARTMTLSAWSYQAAEPGGGPDRQLLLIYDVDPATNTHGQHSPIAYVFGERVDAQAWQRRTVTIDVTAYRGRNLWVYATVANDGLGGRAWMWLDDVDARFCP